MSARRVSLSDLADQQAISDPAHDEVVTRIDLSTAPGETPASQVESKTETVKAPTPLRAGQPKRIQPEQQPHVPHMRYDEYERKETRLRDDQYGRLTTASRRLNKQRKGRGERITENTLIRVAIDLLLNEEDKLNGTTETELRKSVGL